MIHSGEATNWKGKEDTDRLGTLVTVCYEDNTSYDTEGEGKHMIQYDAWLDRMRDNRKTETIQP
jgi:hypothetical protein